MTEIKTPYKTRQTGPMRSTNMKADEVLAYIKNYIYSRGYPPTIREIETGLYISSTSVVTYYLKNLSGRGKIERGRGARAIKILDGVGPQPVCPQCGQGIDAA